MQVEMRIGGRTGNDAVEIFGIARHFDQSLPATRGAAVPIGVFRTFAIVGTDDCLRCDDGVMHGAIAEIDNFLRMAQREHTVAAFVTGVCRSGGVAFFHRLRHGGVADHAGPSAVADDFDLAVPVLGHPDFHPDVGIRRGLECRGHTAIGREE